MPVVNDASGIFFQFPERRNLLSPTHKLEFQDNEAARILYGNLNRNLELIENSMDVSIKVRGAQVTITGQEHDIDIAQKRSEGVEMDRKQVGRNCVARPEGAKESRQRFEIVILADAAPDRLERRDLHCSYRL